MLSGLPLPKVEVGSCLRSASCCFARAGGAARCAFFLARISAVPQAITELAGGLRQVGAEGWLERNPFLNLRGYLGPACRPVQQGQAAGLGLFDRY